MQEFLEIQHQHPPSSVGHQKGNSRFKSVISSGKKVVTTTRNRIFTTKKNKKERNNYSPIATTRSYFTKSKRQNVDKLVICSLVIIGFLPFLLLNIISLDTDDLHLGGKRVASSFHGKIRKTKKHKDDSLSEVSWGIHEMKHLQHELPLERAPGRIPGYIEGQTDKTYFGYVMRDFSQRVLSRHIASSDVLVVSPHAQDVISFIDEKNKGQWDEEEARKSFGYTVGESFLLAAAQQQHQVHGLDVDVPANKLNVNNENKTSRLDQWWNIKKPSWILLAVFDLPPRTEDSIISSAVKFWSEATVTYTVLRVHATAAADNHYGGLEAVKTLLHYGYKVQLLSASHEANFRPNMLITSGNVDIFFHTGAKAVMGSDGETFTAYLFATQGLDLAIPSRREHLNRTNIRGTNEMINSLDRIPYAECPLPTVDIHFREASFFSLASLSRKKSQDQGLKIYPLNAGHVLNTSYWWSGKTPESSEAACIRADLVGKDKTVTRNQVACKTRILPKDLGANPMAKTDKENTPNLLLIMIDPISRARFDQALPKTKKLLNDLKFTSFDNYTAVGDNSGPNQAALYSGLPLKSRKSIASHGQSGTKWLWDELRDAGYSTFKAEDGCIKNSNMIQSIKPNTTHGDDLHQMLCYDFARPNCLGGTSAADHLARYALRFVEAYNEKKPWAAFLHFIDSHEDTGMLAGTIDGTISRILHQVHGKIGNARWENTAVTVISDHGLHYGPYFQSARGQLERIEPILYFKPPHSRSLDTSTLKKNSNKFTTPFDVHTTLLEITLGFDKKESLGTSLLTPLGQNRETCDGVEEIPKRYCELIRQKNVELNSSDEMPFPPSILSYYADIPQGNKPRRRQCSTKDSLPKNFGRFDQQCDCATSHRKWFPCNKHPWAQAGLHSNEHFAMIDCPNRTLDYETRVIAEEKVQKRFALSRSKQEHKPSIPSILFVEVDSASIAYSDRHFPKTRELLYRHRLRQENGGYSCHSGLCAADFSSFSITGPHSISNQVSALSGCLSFPRGESCNKTLKDEGAICTEKNEAQYGLKMNKYHGRYHDSHWCMPDIDVKMQAKSSFLYDIAISTGHVTLFSEEFCWPGSPYVVQDNILALRKVDFAPHKVFCRLAERTSKLKDMNLKPRELWKAEDPNEPCIDGFSGKEKAQISFEHILQTWDAYSDTPKFAFLNAIAAHDYNADWSKVTMSAESYDDHLSSLLETMLSRKDANNTVIILRADHGLQYGPLVVDYSTQIEHVRPWTQLIVPENLDGLSLESLFANQDKLACGADLYRTLRALMTANTPGTTEPTNFLPSVPDWSYNLLTSKIPSSRSCNEARIPLKWCRKKELEPRFGVCNSFGGSSQKLHCES